jgi:hypothetical protein
VTSTSRRSIIALLLPGLVVAWSLAGRHIPGPAPASVLRAAPVGARQRAAIPSNPQRNAYFGDLHVHTSWSLDAYAIGGNRVDDPTVAYRFGRGDAIADGNGRVRGQLRVPLDFMAVTDHDAYLAETQACSDPADAAYTTMTCQELRKGGQDSFMKLAYPFYYAPSPRHPDEICGTGSQEGCVERQRHRWAQVQKNANDYYQPGKFTTFIAYEWTAQKPGAGGAWFHRNVIFRNEHVPAWGGSAVQMKYSPERLWQWLEQACAAPCDVVAIPHNSNFGGGLMLAPQNSDGTPFTVEILKRREKFERLIEVHQIKGNSECLIGLGTTDEECNFEQQFRVCKNGEDSRCAFASDYVRNALKSGLETEQQYGINAFKYGLIGSTDTHVTAPGSTDETGTWVGGMGVIGGTPTVSPSSPGQNPGGLAGVWAEQNTRDSIFDALKRRETFATSGTRVRVRLFGSWRYAADLHRSRDLIKTAYATGVPMGGDLPVRPKDGRAPRFVVWATKDPNSANLQKVQIVKGWTSQGKAQEQVYDVVCADGVAPDATHRCADSGAVVDLATCAPSAGKGSAELSTTWTDPDFNPDERAFYYARVLENPTCRWSTRQRLAVGQAPPDGVPPTIRERAWSSPIWYSPTAK